MLTKDQKIILLKEILDRKDVIFGSYNSMAEGKKRKQSAWTEIVNVLSSTGYTKGIDDLRDAQWKNLRASTMVSGIK